MKIGTKSILYGAHCFFVHPFLVAVAWWRLYGFPFDIRLWVAFAVHDLGYIGRGDMNDAEGEDHVHLGATIMRRLFGRHWEEFTRCHSRYWAKRTARQFSRLCVADKLAFVIAPLWLYLPMTRWTGELPEYMEDIQREIEDLAQLEPWEKRCLRSTDQRVFLEGLRSYTKHWVEKHKDSAVDEWTVPRKRLVSYGHQEAAGTEDGIPKRCKGSERLERFSACSMGAISRTLWHSWLAIYTVASRARKDHQLRLCFCRTKIRDSSVCTSFRRSAFVVFLHTRNDMPVIRPDNCRLLNPSRLQARNLAA